MSAHKTMRNRIAKSVIGTVAIALLAACGGGTPGAKGARASNVDLATPLINAVREEAKGDPAKAIALYEDALEAAVNAPDSRWQLVVEQAALDALVWRSVPSFEEVTEDSALAYRTGTTAAIEARLAKIAAKADDAFSAGLIARAMEELTTFRGDAAEGAKWHAARGCANEATIAGPLTWTSVTGVTDPDPLAAADAKIDAFYTLPGAFGSKQAPVVVRGRGCGLDLAAPSNVGGVRDVVVDVDVKAGVRIGVSLRAHSAATLRAGGLIVIDRAYELGGGDAARFARVDVKTAGTLRLVARVGMDDDSEAIEIGAWDEHGKALAPHAPKVGDAANVKVATFEAIGYPAAKGDTERAALAIGALAAGDGRIAEQVTAFDSARADASPELLLAYARAVETARDLDPVHRAERARGAYERVIDAWPTAWEAIVAHAVLAGVRRGQSEQHIEALRDLDAHREKAGRNAIPLLDAFDAASSGHDHLWDRARAALERAKAALPKTPLVRDASRAVIERTGADRAAFECATDADADRSRLDCYDALRASGDRAGAAKELDRLRAILAGPQLFLSIAMREALTVGDAREIARIYDAMLPGERTLAGLYAAAPARPASDGGKSARDKLLALALVARDAPSSLPPLFRALGEDPTSPFEGIGEKVTAEDHAKAILPSAATAVLAHVERYDVDRSGLVRFVLFDVRRVSGTTDVEENAQASPPDIQGRTTMRILRRRIFKKDGRILEPDRTPNASQGHADLSQLEQGDAIEAIYEGWSLPGESGNISIDTPDLLPERTGVHDATIELRLPSGLKSTLWTHPLLGKAVESKEGDQRVLRWTAKDAPVRRLEDGTPKMDRDVSVSFSTSSWSETAQGMREAIAALDEHDPEITKWAQTAAKDKKSAGEIVNAIVDAAGTTVKEASPSTLSDLEIGRPVGAQNVTARAILSNHEGSRTWLIVRALRELGIKADVVIAENEPYSADPAFPPHGGRFTHPLAVAHVSGAANAKDGAGDVWIDADVPGPPLPAGHISPELRGRSALHADGAITALPALSESAETERDEVDIRLAVDAKGDAKGSLTILLRGRAAQELAETLVRIVGDERQRALRGVALAWVPFANVDDVQLSSSEGSWQVAVRAELTIPAYAQVEGSAAGAAQTWVLPGIDPLHIVFPRPYVRTLSSTYATQGGSRQDALAVNRAVQYHAHRRVELPAGASVARVPGAFEVHDSIVSASRKIRVAANVVEDEFALSVSTGTVAADHYGAFVADAHKVDDAFLASTRIKPTP